MARKPQPSFMPEVEIQRLEQLPDEEAALTGAQVKRLLHSYRLAANVANTAWAVLGGDSSRALALQTALHDYAPEHFPRLPPRVVDALEELYNEASQHSEHISPVFLDWFFSAILACRKAT